MPRLLRAALLLLLLPAAAPALSVTLAWDAAVPQDAQVVPEGYVLTRNGVQVLRTDALTATDRLPGPGTYTYTVQSFAKADLSDPSNAVEVVNPGVSLTCAYGLTSAGFSLVCATPVVPPPGPYPLRPVGSVTAQADSAETVGENGRASQAVDGLPTTIWHTQWQGGAPPLPHTLTLDLGAVLWVEGIAYTPRQDGNLNGTIVQYRIETTLDGLTWTVASTGSWPGDASAKRSLFPAVQARSVRLVALLSNGTPYASATEVGVYAVVGGTP
jgi:hypothetical protein